MGAAYLVIANDLRPLDGKPLTAGMATVADKPAPINDHSPVTFNRQEIPYFSWRLPLKKVQRFTPGRLGLEIVEELSFAKDSTVERKYIGLLLRGGVRVLTQDDLVRIHRSH